MSGPGDLDLVDSDEPLSDYGRVHRGEAGYHVHRLTEVEGLRRVIDYANQASVPVRVRGAGHSMNGTAVPRRGEILISTQSCCHFRFEKELTVTVGAGAAVWDVEQTLNHFGYELLVCNDGGAAASTIGGFISAGGIGERSWNAGGFWSTVDEIVMVTGGARVLRLTPGDEIWPWIFGSMGQLGVIVEARVRIQARANRPDVAYPMGTTGQVAVSAASWPHHGWLTLFVPDGGFLRARMKLTALMNRHADIWTPCNDYIYRIPFKGFNPPLVYPRPESFVAFGSWGVLADGAADEVTGLARLEADFAALVNAEPSYRRYIQAEFTSSDESRWGYFGKDVLEAFRGPKRTCDPKCVLGHVRFDSGG